VGDIVPQTPYPAALEPGSQAPLHVFRPCRRSTKHLRVCLFCLWSISSWMRVVRLRNFAHRRMTTICRTCSGMSKGVVVAKKWHFSKKYLHVGQQIRSGDGSVGWLVGWLHAGPSQRRGKRVIILTLAGSGLHVYNL